MTSDSAYSLPPLSPAATLTRYEVRQRHAPAAVLWSEIIGHTQAHIGGLLQPAYVVRSPYRSDLHLIPTAYVHSDAPFYETRPIEASAPTTVRDDNLMAYLQYVRETQLVPCMAHDAGLPGGCSCPDEDPRNVISRLTAIIDGIQHRIQHWTWAPKTRADAKPWQEGGGPDPEEMTLDHAAHELRGVIAAYLPPVPVPTPTPLPPPPQPQPASVYVAIVDGRPAFFSAEPITEAQIHNAQANLGRAPGDGAFLVSARPSGLDGDASPAPAAPTTPPAPTPKDYDF